MQIKDLKTLKEFFKKYVKTPIFGVGVYAFHRIGLEDFIPNYRIIALRYSKDTKLMEKNVEVLSLEKGMSRKHIREPRNSTTVIKHPKTKEYLSKFKKPALIVYKSSGKMERVCKENDWTLIASPIKFGKRLFENKIKFRKILEEIGVPVPPGKITSLEKLHYGHLMNAYGLPFVIQHPTKGGGKGTFFIKNHEDFKKAYKKLRKPKKEEWESGEEEIPPEEIIVAKYVEGPSPSITGCVTRHGILSTNPQYQILDIPELYSPEKGSGLFCGHDWSSSDFSENIKNQAYDIVEKVGKYFQKQGYKGIFGLDFIMDEEEEKLYVTETNPRLLGSFPTLTMIQIRNKETPIIAFHILEHLGIDYQIDVKEINQIMRQKKEGSQLLLHNLTRRWTRNYSSIKAGVYKIKIKSQKSKVKSDYELEFVRSGYALKHAKRKDEFLVTEGVPFKKSHFSPNRRLCRVITSTKALENYRQLTPWTYSIVRTVYKAFNLKRIRFVRLKKLLKPHLLAKG